MWFDFSRVELFDGKGGIVEASLVQIRNTSVELAAVTTCQILPPTSPHWHVAAAFGGSGNLLRKSYHLVPSLNRLNYMK